MKSIGERIKELREDKGINQLELSKIFNVHKGTISNWENNKRTPDTEMLKRISDFFNCSVDYLVGNSDIKNPLKNSGNDELIKAILNSDKENANEFTSMLEQKLKESGLYDSNVTYEEKVELANKILDILKIIKKK